MEGNQDEQHGQQVLVTADPPHQEREDAEACEEKPRYEASSPSREFRHERLQQEDDGCQEGQVEDVAKNRTVSSREIQQREEDSPRDRPVEWIRTVREPVMKLVEHRVGKEVVVVPEIGEREDGDDQNG